MSTKAKILLEKLDDISQRHLDRHIDMRRRQAIRKAEIHNKKFNAAVNRGEMHTSSDPKKSAILLPGKWGVL